MRLCRHCGVKLANDIKRCPLCDMMTEQTDDVFDKDYPYVKSRFTRDLLLQLITFAAIAMASASLLVDHLVPTGSPWAIITVVAIVYLWISSMNILRFTPNPASIMLCQLWCAGGLVFVIDYLTGYYRWSVNYVIPFMVMAAAIATMLMILIRPMKYRAYIIYLLVIAVLGVLSVLVWIFGYSDIEWPVVTSAFVSAVCFFAVIVFLRRRTRNEIMKRFHV